MVFVVMPFISLAALVPIMSAPVSAVLVPLVLLPTLPLYFALVLVLLIVTLVVWFVFPRSNEIYGPIAGIVFVAVPAPIFRMIRWYVQINGRSRSLSRVDQHRPCVDDRRGTFVPNIHLTV